MYQNVNTGEIWELDHVEEIPNNPKPLKVYVFENGERWAEDLFFRHFRKVGEAEQSVHPTRAGVGHKSIISYPPLRVTQDR
jgi:hypothetical protein